MVLIRGKRHANGRTDVLVYTPAGEEWLHEATGRRMSASRQYEWGAKGTGCLRLAADLLHVATANALVVELLTAELMDQWLSALNRDDWSYATFEIQRWVVSELANEVIRHRENPAKGGMPCPSEN